MNVVFDLGAVLLTWEPAALVRAQFPAHAADVSEAAQLARTLFQHADWLAFDQGLRSLEQVASCSAPRVGIPYAELLAFLSGLAGHLQPIAETEALLYALHAHRKNDPGLRLYYLSNMPQPYARVVERLPLFECFDGGVFSGDVKRVKPHEEIYQRLAWQFNLVPEDTLFIDDTAANVAMARALGWHALHCTAPTALAAQVWRRLGVER